MSKIFLFLPGAFIFFASYADMIMQRPMCADGIYYLDFGFVVTITFTFVVLPLIGYAIGQYDNG